MSVIVKARNTTVTPALKQYVEKKIEKVTRQFKTVGDITAVLRVEKDNHVAEITVPANGILLRAQETTKDMYSSIDLVVEKIERQVIAALNADEIEVTQGMFDALVSLAYNIGVGGLSKSSVIRHLKAGNKEAAADAFLLWNKAGDRVLAGLTRRRQAERRVFLG